MTRQHSDTANGDDTQHLTTFNCLRR